VQTDKPVPASKNQFNFFFIRGILLVYIAETVSALFHQSFRPSDLSSFFFRLFSFALFVLSSLS
jgi:hypothetical protein